MQINSINTNLAAFSAQANIRSAQTDTTAAVARLSSGNKITQASDDVAGLSIGTSLATNVSTLRTALVNASQGTSLLAVADSALNQITEILQRQKAIAVQAGSGTLGSTERAFLDAEFQALSDEIDRIATNTNFNGVKLIDGSLSSSSKVEDSTRLASAGTATISLSSNLTDGDTININGLVFTARTAPSNDQEFTIGVTASDTAKNLAAKLTSLTTSNAATITDSTTTYAQKLGANTYTANNGGEITIAARSGGEISNRFTIDASATTEFTVSGEYGSAYVDLLATNVSAFTSATATVAVASGQSATAPFRVGDTLSIKLDTSAAIGLYTFQTGDSLTDIVNGINSSSDSTGVSATLIGSSGTGYNIRLNLSQSTGTNVSVNGGNNFYKASDGTQTTTLSGATSTAFLLSDSLADAIGSTSASVVENTPTATAPFTSGSFIFASVNGDDYVAISSALTQGDGLDDIVANINATATAGSLGIVAQLNNGNIEIQYADSQQSGAISFFAGTGAGTETDLPTSVNTFSTDALGQNATAGRLGGSYVSFNILSTGVLAPDVGLTDTTQTSIRPFAQAGNSTITISINDSATAALTETYTVGADDTLQDIVATINNDATSIAKGLHASIVLDSQGKYNIQVTYAASELPPASTGGTAVANGIQVSYANASDLSTINTTGTLNNTSTTLGTADSHGSTYRLFTTEFASSLSAGQVVASASGSAAAPFVNNDTLTLRYGTTNITLSDAIATGDTLADIVDKINANTSAGQDHGITARLDGNGTNILLEVSAVDQTNFAVDENQLYFTGGQNFYTPQAGDTGAAFVTNGFNNSYTSVNLFTGDITSGGSNSIAASTSDGNNPLDSDENLVIAFDAEGATRTVTIALAAGETFDTLVTKINDNTTAQQYGLKATRTGTLGLGNITLTFADSDNTGAIPANLSIANANSQATLNTALTGAAHTAVDPLLKASSVMTNTTSAAVGITSQNVIGLAGGLDNGLGFGSTTVSGSVSDALLTSLAQKSAEVTIGFADTDPSALATTFGSQTLTVGGSTFTFVTSASSPLEIEIGATLQETIDNAVSTINKYGAETAIGDTAYQLNQIDVTRDGNSIVFTGKGIGNVTKLDGTAVTDIATTVANVSGPTNSGDLNNATRSGTGTFGVDVSGISNADFIGEISGFTAEYVTANTVNLSVTVGGHTYTAVNVNTKPLVGATGSDSLGNAVVRFYSDTVEDTNGKELNGGYFDIQLAANQGNSVSNQAQATAFGTRLNSAFQGLNFNQTRNISSYSGDSAIINASGTTTGSLVGSSVRAQLESFDNNKVTDISVSAPTASSSNASFSITIDGTRFVADSIGTSLGANQTYRLTSENDASYFVEFTTGNTAIDLSTTENAQAFEDALREAFGTQDGSAALSFQVGTTTSDTLGVNISDAKTSALYNDADLNVLTQEAAAAAVDALDTAIQNVTAVRASVGALQSRFNFAAANIEASIQNQDAARGTLLDTDIADESTKYAISQVKLQAGISVLAQANQQLQSLLKLIG